MACSKKNTVIYVDASASVQGKGTKTEPFRSLPLAFAKAKDLLTETTQHNITLSLSEGTYRIYDTLSMNGQSLGNLASSLTFEGVPEKTVITSAIPFDPALFEKVGENLYAAKLSGMGKFRYLYVDGKIATMAHMGGKDTDDEDMHTMRYNREVNFKDDGKDPIKECKVYLALDMVKPMLGDATSGKISVNAEWHIECEWNYNIVHMTAVDLDDTVVFDCETIKDKHYANYFPGVKETHVACYINPAEYVAFSLHKGYPTENRHYFLANNKNFIRKENDYYYDFDTETLYYYTEGDILSHEFACAKLDNLFFCKNAKNITFRGITFTGTDNLHLSLTGHMGGQACSEGGYLKGHTHDFPTQSAFYSDGRNANLAFENCRFYELACEGIRLSGFSENFTVKDCKFVGLGSAAIRSGNPQLSCYNSYAKGYGSCHVLIENNLIASAGREYYEAPGIMFSACKDITICHNTIHTVPYTGISLGWNWCYNGSPYGTVVNIADAKIYKNYIYDYMRNLADGGAIYTLGGNAPKEDHELHNKSYENCVVMTKSTGTGRGVCLMGIYYDGASTNWHSKNNLVVEQSYGAAYEEENPGYDERFLWTFHERRRHAVFYFSQNAGTAAANNWSYNILHDDCFLIRCRTKDPAKYHQELCCNTMCEERWVIEKNMCYVHTWDELPEKAAQIITTAGAKGYGCDLEELKKDRY